MAYITQGSFNAWIGKKTSKNLFTHTGKVVRCDDADMVLVREVPIVNSDFDTMYFIVARLVDDRLGPILENLAAVHAGELKTTSKTRRLKGFTF